MEESESSSQSSVPAPIEVITIDENNSGDPEKRKSSIAHQYFEPQGLKLCCKLCRKLYAKDKSGSTSGLLRHLQNNHPTVLSADGKTSGKSLKQTRLTGNRIEVFTKEVFKQKLLKLFLAKDLSFNLVDDKYFRDLLEYCNPDAITPGDTTFRRNIKYLYETEKQKLRITLEKAPGKLSFVVDCWTPNQMSYQGVIVTFIDCNWELQNILLDVTPLSGTHSGSNLCLSFTSLLESFGILEKLLAVTMDNATNMDTFCTKLHDYLSSKALDFDQENMRVRCLAHIINLACKDAINSLLVVGIEETATSTSTQDIDEDEDENEYFQSFPSSRDATKSLIGKLRKGVVKIRSSPQRREAYLRQCLVTNLKSKLVIEDVPTRWNSTYMMIKRAIKMREAYDTTIYWDAKLKQYGITNDEWTNLNHMLEFLQPFKTLTASMMEGKYPSIGLCGLVYLELFQHVESHLKNADNSQPKYPEWLETTAKCAFVKLDKYYPSSDGAVYVIGSVMDPRLKLEWHKQNFPNDIVTKYRSIIKSHWEKHYKPEKAHIEENSQEREPDIFERQMSKRARVTVK